MIVNFLRLLTFGFRKYLRFIYAIYNQMSKSVTLILIRLIFSLSFPIWRRTVLTVASTFSYNSCAVFWILKSNES